MLLVRNRFVAKPGCAGKLAAQLNSRSSSGGLSPAREVIPRRDNRSYGNLMLFLRGISWAVVWHSYARPSMSFQEGRCEGRRGDS